MPETGLWANDGELFGWMRKTLYSAVIGDILDQMRRFHQFLPPQIRPLREDMVIAGRAMCVLEADMPAGDGAGAGHNPVLGKSFGLMLEALDDLKENEVYLCAGASPQYALVGELMCTRMRMLGAAGAVIDGFHRDTRGILELGLPCFSLGGYAQDQAPRGKVIDYRVPVEIGGVHVDPGDIVFGDRDGVVVIPRGIEREVLERSAEKASGERTVGKAILSGVSASDAFRIHGIL